MKKYLSLIRACMTDNMSIFKINGKKRSEFSKKILPIVLAFICFFSIWSYANVFMEPLVEVHMEYVLLTLFAFFTCILTLTEGIYKSSSILFNCKDDNMLLSLPISKYLVLFIRILKFYLFEVLYNTLFMLPAMVVYARYIKVGISYWMTSIIALLILPIIPIIVSCIIGGIISLISSYFKKRSFAQTVITMGFLLVVLYGSINLENIIKRIAENAEGINEIITKLYFPIGNYIRLVTNFHFMDLFIFILTNIFVFTISIILFGKVYYKINSLTKNYKRENKNNKYNYKRSNKVIALIKKEFNRFFSSPVFITNAGFGLILFLIGCIGINLKLDSVIEIMAMQGVTITIEEIQNLISIILFGFICFTALMSSITSSMISLEGKTFNILKSLPVKTFEILISKIVTAVVIMIPVLFIGDILIFIKFSFSFLEMVMLIIDSIILPVTAETIGLIVNLKYPKMDAENDTEVVKQSASSMVSVLIGMIMIGITVYGLYKGLETGLESYQLIIYSTIPYFIICSILLGYLYKIGVKDFEKISV